MGLAVRLRFRALIIHMLASIVVVGGMIAGMYLTWYPSPLDRLQGWIDLLWIVIGVDIVLGPCLTFVVYSPGKKSLRFDLAIIVLVQLAALAYGVYTSAMGRPAYLVFIKDRFEVVTVAEYPDDELRKAKSSPFTKFPWFGPVPVAAVMPTDANEAARILFSDIAGGGLKIMPQYYQPYRTAAQAAIARSKTLLAIGKVAPRQAKALSSWARSENRDPDTVCFVPLKAKLGYGLVMLDNTTGKIISMKAINPAWY